MTTLRYALFACAGIGALLSAPSPSAAQTAPSTPEVAGASATVEEVVVTAEHRETSVQATPIAITALTSRALERANVQSVERLVQLTPSLHYNDTIGESFLSIRSVGGEPNTTIGGDPSVSFNVDGVYIARPTSVSSTLFDVERIEVLRGPQGTLYGRNSTGGAINVITKAPNFTEFGGTADVLFGDYDRVRARAAINIPIVADRVALRISGVTDRHNGYVKNIFYPDGSDDLEDLDTKAVRGQLGIRLTDNVDLVLRADTTLSRSNGPALTMQGPYGNPAITAPAPFGYGAPPNPDSPFVISKDLLSQLNINDTGESAELRWHGLGGVGLTVIATHRKVDYSYADDADSTAAKYVIAPVLQSARQDSVEARLASESGGPLSWQVGAYYFREKGFTDVSASIFVPNGALALLAQPRLDIVSTSEALFGQATYALSDRLHLTGGLRYTWDTKDAVEYVRVTQYIPFSFSQNVITPSSKSWSSPTGKVTLDYTLSQDALLYGTISRGYKAGGYGLDGPAFNPETIWAYEAGLKTRLFDRRLQLNYSAFYYDEKNLQVSLQGTGISGAPTLITENAGAATAWGVEAEFQATPVRDLNLRGSLAYLNARYDKYLATDALNPAAGVQNLAGRAAVFAPNWNVSFDASYRLDLGRLGSLEPGVSYYWVSKQFLRVFETPPGDIQPAYSTVDLRLAYRPPTGTWSIEGFVENAADTKYKLSSQANVPMNSLVVGYGPPRTAGIKVSADF